MIITTESTDDLKKLPLRAIVAFAARCARRVEHLYVLPLEDPQASRAALAAALAIAEDFARGLPCPTAEAVIREIEAREEPLQNDVARESAYAAARMAAHAAVSAMHAIAVREEPEDKRLVSGGPPLHPLKHLADVTADLAALDAYTAAVDAADAVGYADHFMIAAGEDYRKLQELDLGRYPEAGRPVNPSPDGPLGPLEPGTPPARG